MRHQDLDTEAQHDLRAIVRSVDKKIQMQVQDGRSPQDQFVTVGLSQGSAQASMEVSIEELRRARESARDRALLRERVKRTRERMWFPSRPSAFFPTKAIRPGSESLAQIRTSGGRRY